MIPPALLACAPTVAPVTLESVIRVESGGNPLALHVNGLPGRQPQPASLAQAIRIVQIYMLQGYSVDLGLMQVNSTHLGALGYSVAQAFDPCTNIRGGAVILTADYAEAARTRGNGRLALEAALSAYNTGSFFRGFANGYVAKYFGRLSIPEIVAAAEGSAKHHPAPPTLRIADTQPFLLPRQLISRPFTMTAEEK